MAVASDYLLAFDTIYALKGDVRTYASRGWH